MAAHDDDDDDGIGGEITVTFQATLEAVFADKTNLQKILPAVDADLPTAVSPTSQPMFTPLTTMMSTLNHLVPLPSPLTETTSITIK